MQEGRPTLLDKPREELCAGRRVLTFGFNPSWGVACQGVDGGGGSKVPVPTLHFSWVAVVRVRVREWGRFLVRVESVTSH